MLLTSLYTPLSPVFIRFFHYFSTRDSANLKLLTAIVESYTPATQICDIPNYGEFVAWRRVRQCVDALKYKRLILFVISLN